MCPYKLLPTLPTLLYNHCVSLENKCRIGPLPCTPPHEYAVVMSTEAESRFTAEDHTPLVTIQLVLDRKNPVDTVYDGGGGKQLLS